MIAFALALTLAGCDPASLPQVKEEQRTDACDLLERTGQVSAVDRAALAAIYEEPGFERARMRGSDELARWLAWLREKLEGLFESSGAETYSVWTRFLVLTGAALAAIALLGRLWRQRVERTAIAAAASAALTLEPPPRHLELARAQLPANPRAAIREGLLAVLSHLERARLARPDRVKTNREILAELPNRGATQAQVASVEPLLRWYDDTYYSLAEVALAEAQRFLDRAQAFTAEPT